MVVYPHAPPPQSLAAYPHVLALVVPPGLRQGARLAAGMVRIYSYSTGRSAEEYYTAERPVGRAAMFSSGQRLQR